MQLELAPISKAITAGLVTALVALLAHYGLNVSDAVNNALQTIILAIVSYLIAHIAVYVIPNKKS